MDIITNNNGHYSNVEDKYELTCMQIRYTYSKVFFTVCST